MYQNIYIDNLLRVAYVWDDELGMIQHPFQKYAYKKSEFGEYRSIYGDTLEKVTNYDPKDRELFESDVPTATRILIDLYPDSDELSVGHTVLTFDIEVDVGDGLPNIEEAKSKITSIALHDSTADEYFAMVLDPEGMITNHLLENGVTIETYDDEYDLLSRFLNLYEGINPTIVTGWSIDRFDIPYLLNRIKRVMGDEAARRLSPISDVYFSKYRQRYFLAGVSCLDYLMLYKKFTYSEEPTYRLDAIALKELGAGKLEYEGSLDDLYRNDRRRYVEYNLMDVELVVKLDKKLQLIELTRGICHIGHVPYEDIVFSSRYLEGAILTYLKSKDLVAPNKPRGSYTNEDRKDEDKFTGAYVKEPTPGKYDWIFDLDLTSLYPSIIMSLNLSPESKLVKIENWNADAFVKNKEHKYRINNEVYSKADIVDFMREYKLSLSSNGVLFQTENRGVIPTILETWFDKRREYQQLSEEYAKSGDTEKHDFYDKRQHIQKILLNSLYGYVGLPVGRFYDVDIAEAVTVSGQTVIKFTENMINRFYNEKIGGEKQSYVIYVDTDSTFVSAIPIIEKLYPNVDRNDDEQMTNAILEISQEVQDYVNESYNMLSKALFNVEKHRFDIKREYVAKAGIWVAKKRYAQWVIFKKGIAVDELDVKGLDIVRSSFPAAFKEFFTELLKLVLKGKTKEEVDATILDFKKSLPERNMNDLARNGTAKALTKYDLQNTTKYNEKSKKFNRDIKIGWRKLGTPAHVKAALAFNELLYHYKISTAYSPLQDSDKFKWVYIKANSMGIDGIAFRGYNDPTEIMNFVKQYVDYEKIYDRELKSKIVDVYSALGWIMLSDNYSTASKFFQF